MYPVDPPLIGPWEFSDFPDTIELEGKVFALAERSQPYEGVIAQYREMVPLESAHLFVTERGEWVIDHIDQYNPDMGYPLRHLVFDHPKGTGLLLMGAGVVGLAGSALAGIASKQKEEKR